MQIKEWLLAEEKEEGNGSTLIKDTANHGCQGGVPGLIYYNETVAFHDEHEEEIWQLLEDYADNEASSWSTKWHRFARMPARFGS